MQPSLAKETVVCLVDQSHDEPLKESIVRAEHTDEESLKKLHTIRRGQNVKRKVGLTIIIALALTFAGQSRLGAYVLQEALVVVLGIAVLLLPILLTLIVFLLLWQGTSFVLLRTRLTGRITSVRDRPLALNRR